jgi:transposase
MHECMLVGAMFQYACMTNNLRHAANQFNVPRETFRRHYNSWRQLGMPFEYTLDETRGRDSKLTTDQCSKLYDLVSIMITEKQFINDFILRRLIQKHFTVDVSPSFIVAFKQKYKLSSIKPSYSRVAAFDPHSAWIERQFLRDVRTACDTLDHDCIFNADETFCRTFPHSVSKVYGLTNTGREGRQVKIDTDVKQGITCMTTITAAGGCLSPYFVKKGCTSRCIKDFIEDNIMATFSDNGWMNETVAIRWIDAVLLPHLAGRPGCLIWDIFKAHMTPGVREHLLKHDIKPLYVPASMTWKRQPLDTHIFSVLKKQYQAHYFDTVFVKKEKIKQRETVYAYNVLMQNINKSHIVSAFNEAILYDAKSVPSIENDPHPKPKEAMDVESSQTEQDDELDDSSLRQYEDEPLDESSGDEIPEEMPSMRRPRQAHSVARDAQLAQAYQSNIIR